MSLVTAVATMIVPTPAHGDDIKTVKIGNIPLPISGNVNAAVTGNVNAVVTGNVNATVSGNVGLVGTPDVAAHQAGSWDVGITGNTSANPLFVQSVSGQPTLVSDGRAFVLPPNPNIAFEFAVPSGVVLTDVQLSLTAPSLAATIFVSTNSNSKTYVFQSVGSANSTFAGSNAGYAALHFQSGLQSAEGLRVGIYCNNIGSNSCAGALMWSGYQP
jgi:hypothetical protein